MADNTFYVSNNWHLALTFIGFSCTNLFICFFNPRVAQENSLIEISQGVLLLLSILLHVYAYKFSAPTDNALEKSLRMGLIIFCVAVLLRETDINRWGNSSIWKQLELLLRGATVIGALTYSYFMLGKLRWLLTGWRPIIQHPTIFITMFGGIAYLAGWFFDKKLFPISTESSLLIEELFELNATALFVIGAAVQIVPKRAQLCEN